MSLICKDGLSSCTGCGSCLNFLEVCSVCKTPLVVGEKYYKLWGKTVCPSCTSSPGGDICIFCRKPASDGFRYKDIVLCRSCSKVATGYVGYI